jgi:hypothetical protein
MARTRLPPRNDPPPPSESESEEEEEEEEGEIEEIEDDDDVEMEDEEEEQPLNQPPAAPPVDPAPPAAAAAPAAAAPTAIQESVATLVNNMRDMQETLNLMLEAQGDTLTAAERQTKIGLLLSLGAPLSLCWHLDK